MNQQEHAVGNADMSLLVRIGADGSGMEQGFAKAAGFAREQFKALAGFFAAQFTVGNIVGNVTKALDFANTMRDNAEATGVGVEALQALNIAATQAGAGAEKLQRGLFMIQRAQAEISTAAEGSEKIASAFEKLGVSEQQIITSSPDRILELIGKKLAEGGDSAAAFSAAVSIFGERIGPNFLQALRDIGNTGLDPMVARLKESGAIMNDELTKQLDQAKKSLEMFEQKKTIFFGKGFQGMQDFADLVMLKMGIKDQKDFENDPRFSVAREEARRRREVDARAAELKKKDQELAAQGSITIGGQPLGGFSPVMADSHYQAIAAKQIAAERKAATEKAAATKAADDLTAAGAARDAKLRDQAAAIDAQTAGLREQRAFKELSVLGQIAAIHARIAAIEEKRSSTKVQMGADYELMTSQLDLEKTQQEDLLATAENKAKQIRDDAARQIAAAEAGQGIRVSPIAAADNLARIGGFVGGQTDPMMRTAERQLAVQEQILEIMRLRREALGGESGVEE
jgi:hypothetical protein